MRLTKPGATQGAWLTAGRSAAGAVLVAVAVSACTAGGSSPSTITRTPQTGASGAPPAATVAPGGNGSAAPGSDSSTATATGQGGVSASGPAHPSTSSSAHANPGVTTELPSSHPATQTPATTQTSPAPVSTAYPTAAPETGGGGTAGLQDSVLFEAGGAAVLAGLGSLALRRRLARKLTMTASTRDRRPADRDPASR